jgi:hypothetical protein
MTMPVRIIAIASVTIIEDARARTISRPLTVPTTTPSNTQANIAMPVGIDKKPLVRI